MSFLLQVLLIVNHGGQLEKKTKIPEKMLRGASATRKGAGTGQFSPENESFRDITNPPSLFLKRIPCVWGARNKDFKIKRITRNSIHFFF